MSRKSRDAGTDLLKKVRAALEAEGDETRAAAMKAYMKSAMPYRGVNAPRVRVICKDAFATLVFAAFAQWERDVRALWDGARFREERYAAVALTGLRSARAFQTPEAMPLYEHMITTGAWWDFVDELAANRVGPILRTHPKPMRALMLRWSKSDDMWKARTSILCQLRFREHTDLELLYACIEPSIASKEFFLRKAIGWALRAYAHTDMREVKRYVAKNEARLSGLSKREALKHA